MPPIFVSWFHNCLLIGHPFASSISFALLVLEPALSVMDESNVRERLPLFRENGSILGSLDAACGTHGYTLPIPRIPHSPLMRAISIVTDHPALALLVTVLGSEITISSSPSRNPSKTTLPRSTLLIVS